MPQKLQHLIEGLALKKPSLSAASIYRQVAQIAQQQGWTCPTYRTVLNVIRKLDPGLVTLAHEGSKVYRENFAGREAAAAVIRITSGNFRLIHRLCSQIARLMEIDETKTITKELVEAARESLIIGSV